jgi:hypothetical protein
LLKYADDVGISNIVTKLYGLAERYGNRFKPSHFLVRMSKEGSRFFPERPRNVYKRLSSKL